jgi:hypothetical protein
VRRQRKRRGRGPCQGPPDVVLAMLHQSTPWSTCHPRDSHADFHSSLATARSSNSSSSTTVLLSLHSSREQLGHHSRSHQWGTHATTMGRLGTSPSNVACQDRPTHLILQLLWLPSRRASREAQHNALVTPTTPLWRRYPRERKFLWVRSSSMNIPSLYCLISGLHMIS